MKKKHTYSRFITHRRESIEKESATHKIAQFSHWKKLFLFVAVMSLTTLFMSTSTDYQVDKTCEETYLSSDTNGADRLSANTFVDSSVKGIQPFIEASNQASENTFQLFSHGKPGELFIEGEWKKAEQIAKWLSTRSPIPPFTHLNIYGCNFAKGKKGKTAVSYLETALGVSIAASDDITGTDGDWNLEVGKPLNIVTVAEYPYNLQNCTEAVTPTIIDISEINPGSGDGQVRLTFDIDCADRSGASSCPDGDDYSIYHYIGFYGQNSPAPNGTYLEYGVTPRIVCQDPAGDVEENVPNFGGTGFTPFCADYKYSTCADFELAQLIPLNGDPVLDLHTWSVPEWCSVQPTYDFELCPGQCYNVYMWEFIVDSPQRTGCKSDNGNVTSNCTFYRSLSCGELNLVTESPVSEVFRICLSGANEAISNPELQVKLGNGSPSVCFPGGIGSTIAFTGEYQLQPEDEGDITNTCVTQDIDCEDDNFTSPCGTQVGNELNDDDIAISFVGAGGDSGNGALKFGNDIETGGDGFTHHVVEINCRESIRIDMSAPLGCSGVIDLTENGIPICDGSSSASTSAIVYISNNGIPVPNPDGWYVYNTDPNYACLVDGTSQIGDPGENGTLQCGITDATQYPNNYTAQFGSFIDEVNDCSSALLGNPFEGAGANPFEFSGTTIEDFGDGIARSNSLICIRFEDPCDGSKSSTCVRFISDMAPITAELRSCNITCQGGNDGQLIIENLLGGSPDPNRDGDYGDGNGLDYIFTLNGSAATFTNTPGTAQWIASGNYPAGAYILTIQDPDAANCASGCDIELNVFIDEPNATLTPTVSTDGCNAFPSAHIAAFYAKDTTFVSEIGTDTSVLLEGTYCDDMCNGGGDNDPTCGLASACGGTLTSTRDMITIEVSGLYDDCPDLQTFDAAVTDITLCFEIESTDPSDAYGGALIYLYPPCMGDLGGYGGYAGGWVDVFNGTGFSGNNNTGLGGATEFPQGQICFTSQGGFPMPITSAGTYTGDGNWSPIDGFPVNGTWLFHIFQNECNNGSNNDMIKNITLTFGSYNCGEEISTFCSSTGPDEGTGEGVNAPNLGIANPTDLQWSSTDDASLNYLVISNPGNGGTDVVFDNNAALAAGLGIGTQVCYDVVGYLPGGQFEIARDENGVELTPNCYNGECCEASTQVCFEVTNCVYPCPIQTVAISATPSTCEKSDGAVSFTPSGGATPYTYIWSNGETTQNLTGVSAGIYSVTATDANSCTVESQIEVFNDGIPPTAPEIAVTDNDCVTNTSGSFSVTTACAAGSSLEWSTDNGATWSTTAPTYDENNALTVIARCVDDVDNTCVSAESTAVISSPNNCCPNPNCFGINIQQN